ncbi:MAG: hypothetical protein HYT62_00485 [Candidatus Yanofskybacteria bacterium]|nr:hypothetical protein [Candidatus Yanofskybacteria bacterium]
MVIWLVFAFVTIVIWYFSYGMDVFLNGGNDVLKSFIEHLTWHIPGGLNRRTAYIKEMVDSMPLQMVNGQPRLLGTMAGSKRCWEYEEIRDNNLYKEVAKDMLGGTIEFWFFSVFLPILIGGIITLGIRSIAYLIVNF